jgi:hypothetical protein
MAQCPDLIPPIDATVELLAIGWDFGSMPLPTGVTITSVISTICTVHTGTDGAASTRLVGGTSIIPSKSSGLASQGVAQMFGLCLPNVTYVLFCQVNTSDGQKPSLWTRFACKPVT